MYVSSLNAPPARVAAPPSPSGRTPSTDGRHRRRLRRAPRADHGRHVECWRRSTGMRASRHERRNGDSRDGLGVVRLELPLPASWASACRRRARAVAPTVRATRMLPNASDCTTRASPWRYSSSSAQNATACSARPRWPAASSKVNVPRSSSRAPQVVEEHAARAGCAAAGARARPAAAARAASRARRAGSAGRRCRRSVVSTGRGGRSAGRPAAEQQRPDLGHAARRATPRRPGRARTRPGARPARRRPAGSSGSSASSSTRHEARAPSLAAARRRARGTRWRPRDRARRRRRAAPGTRRRSRRSARRPADAVAQHEREQQIERPPVGIEVKLEGKGRRRGEPAPDHGSARGGRRGRFRTRGGISRRWGAGRRGRPRGPCRSRAPRSSRPRARSSVRGRHGRRGGRRRPDGLRRRLGSVAVPQPATVRQGARAISMVRTIRPSGRPNGIIPPFGCDVRLMAVWNPA